MLAMLWKWKTESAKEGIPECLGKQSLENEQESLKWERLRMGASSSGSPRGSINLGAELVI